MSFIDSTYFVGEINIPNVTDTLTLAGINQAIGQYEKEILISLLGYKLYSLLIADCTNNVPASQIYLDLVNGAEFDHVYRGETVTLKWEGLKNTQLQSPIAYYVFYKYVERDITRLYPAGVGVSPEGNGWTKVSAVNKLINAWERMRELYGKIPFQYKEHYRHNSDIVLNNTFNRDPSAYNFLYTNTADYPDWIFTPQWNINAFGI